MHRIGILTQPLHFNYGGLLQAYALQKTLKSYGYEVWLINRYYNHDSLYRFLSAVKHLMLSSLLCIKGKRKWHATYQQFKDSFFTSLQFKKKHITPCSKCLTSDHALKHFIQKMKFDGYIVGSDQVWRPKYAPNIYNYFLDFAKDSNVIKMAYAASFGVDNWEFTATETETCKKLLHQFDYVSVREKGGINLCRQYFNRQDVYVTLDPTLLLQKTDYESLIKQADLPSPKKSFIVSYILDATEKKLNILDNLKNIFNKQIYNAQIGLIEFQNRHIKQKATVEEWLYGFMNADFAVVDSFHGCVFSIIFHVPFVAIGNKERGMSRFQSLLSLVNLEERLLDENATVDDIQSLKEIDWDKVDELLQKQREISMSFLSQIKS